MKRRFAAAAVTLLLFSCLAVLGAYNIHQILSHQLLFSWRLPICLAAIFQTPTVRLWFLLLEGCALLLVAWMLFGREYIKYKSKMVHVCLDIWTPAADGQGQYGTAHWLPQKEKETVFTAVLVDGGAAVLQELVAQGRDDLEGCL